MDPIRILTVEQREIEADRPAAAACEPAGLRGRRPRSGASRPLPQSSETTGAEVLDVTGDDGALLAGRHPRAETMPGATGHVHSGCRAVLKSNAVEPRRQRSGVRSESQAVRRGRRRRGSRGRRPPVRRIAAGAGLLLLAFLVTLAPAAAAEASAPAPTPFDLALGGSGSVGLQPTWAQPHGQPTDSGYAERSGHARSDSLARAHLGADRLPRHDDTDDDQRRRALPLPGRLPTPDGLVVPAHPPLHRAGHGGSGIQRHHALPARHGGEARLRRHADWMPYIPNCPGYWAPFAKQHRRGRT